MSELFKFNDETIKGLLNGNKQDNDTYLKYVLSDLDGVSLTDYSMYTDVPEIMDVLKKAIKDGKKIPECVISKRFATGDQVQYLINAFNDGYDISNFAYPEMTIDIMKVVDFWETEGIDSHKLIMELCHTDAWSTTLTHLYNNWEKLSLVLTATLPMYTNPDQYDWNWYREWTKTYRIPYDYDNGQFVAIMLGLYNHLDVSYYAHPKIPHDIMFQVVRALMERRENTTPLKQVDFPDVIDAKSGAWIGNNKWYISYLRIVNNIPEEVEDDEFI